MSQVDQAAGLRRWAESQAPSSSPAIESSSAVVSSLAAVSQFDANQADTNHAMKVLVTLGLPGGVEADVTPVTEALIRWHAQGQRWIEDPDSWRILPLSMSSPHFSALMTQQSRWALWVGDDLDGFRRAYGMLKRLAQQGGPRRLLLVHSPLPSRAGLLNNLQQVAARFLDMQLLVITPPRIRKD
ncbi:hypothetical protein [Halomonas sp. M20]|uniref:hypothetical protein n=1 Tax=Halomonas sp. M20 TaxID=2763264 RepID=UPI001D0BA743|nr:hypothetical protein [Halomonas sp. M20]